MKNRITFLAGWLAGGYLALAQEQVGVELVLDRDLYLANEPLEVRVRVTNRSGQTLHLGKEADWVTFTVTSSDNKIIPRYGELPVASEFVLENVQRGTLRVDLAPYFGLDQQGRYRVVASVNFRELGVLAKSEPATFDIQTGITSWSQEFGVPKRPAEGGGPSEVRKYSLQTAAGRFYIRVADPTGVKVFKVLPLEGAVSYTSPQTQLDKASNLHLLYQSGARSFYYLVISPDGDLLLRQTHVYHEGRAPKLKNDNEGNIQVGTGARQPAPTDLPKPDEPGLLPVDKPRTP